MKNSLKYIYFFFILFASCHKNINKKSSLNNNVKTSSHYAKFDENGKLILKYNYDLTKGEVINDSQGVGIMKFMYTENDRISEIRFLSKDSIYTRYAIRKFEYDTKGRLIQEKDMDISGNILGSVKNYIYDQERQILKKVIPDWQKYYGFSGASVIIYSYNDKKLISKEEYFNLKDEPEIDGEMGIRYITYNYNKMNQLVEEIYHYTGTLEPKDLPSKKWLNEYIYDRKGVLVESRYKYDAMSKKYDNITYFKYDFKNKLYGFGEEKDNILIRIPYNDLSEITYQQLYSNNYYTNFKYPKFRNY